MIRDFKLLENIEAQRLVTLQKTLDEVIQLTITNSRRTYLTIDFMNLR